MEVKEIDETQEVPEGVSMTPGIHKYDTWHFRHGKFLFAIDMPRNPHDDTVGILLSEKRLG